MRSGLSAACSLIGLCVVCSCPALADSPDQLQIDVSKSVAQFGIAHIFVDRVTGTVPIVSGSVVIPAGSSVPTSVTAVLDATRIKTDEPDRDSSLESPDYFDVKLFPTWTFASTKIVPSGPQAFSMDGNLTLHGVTQPEHLEVTIRGDAAHPVYHGVAHIDRHGFGMKGARLDPVIGNDAEITLDITLK